MPNRIIKESVCTSEDLNLLSWQAEVLFYRLMVKADDFGAYYGNESIVKSTCFPLRADEISCEQVKSWLGELSSAGLIFRYTASDGRTYLQLAKWEKHQRTRAANRKFPAFDDNRCQMTADDSECLQMTADDSLARAFEYEYEYEYDNKNNNFKPPTLEEVEVYVKQRGSTVDPKRFWDYFTAGGWKDANGKPVKSWKQKLITWEGREKNGKPVSGNAPKRAEPSKKRHIAYDNE